ncbi:MAG: RNA-binding cell elongation regulator Jag/EloR [Spirochaetia bacterium]
MVREFEGKTEKEAIARAMEELKLSSDQFEIEVLTGEDGKKFGFFKKAGVRIRVHPIAGHEPTAIPQSRTHTEQQKVVMRDVSQALSQGVAFLEHLITLMGYQCQVSLMQREDGKAVFDISSDDSAIIIGKQGKNLDALQVLLNVYLSTVDTSQEESSHVRVIVDSQNYRQRREDAIIRSALKSAEQVVKSKSSRLLEPMSPFERRLVHTALGNLNDIITQSEGEGTGRQIRIIYKGSR